MKLLQIYKNKDGSYTVNSWSNADGSMNSNTYTSLEAVTKIDPLISNTIHGLPRDADFASIWFNGDGSIDKVDYHNNPLTKDDPLQTAVVYGLALTPVKPTLDTLTADIAVKIAPK